MGSTQSARWLAGLVGAAGLGLIGCTGPGDAAGEIRMGAGVPHSDKPFRNDPANFQFAIVGDRTGGHRPGVFARAMERVNALQPEFVVCVGDLIEGYSEDRRVLEAEWDEFDALVDRLDMPFFYTVGNHDVGNPVMLDLWRERLGREYWSFVYRDVLFLSLDTEDPPIELPPDIIERQARFERMLADDPETARRLVLEHARSGPPAELPTQIAISDEQVEFVRETLAAHADVRWTFVLMHKPAWHHESPAFERIEELLADRPYTAIAGHEHYYRYTSRRGRDYLDMATTGGVWLSPGPGSFDHVAWVTMTDDGPRISLIRLDGLLDVTGPEAGP